MLVQNRKIIRNQFEFQKPAFDVSVLIKLLLLFDKNVSLMDLVRDMDKRGGNDAGLRKTQDEIKCG